MEEKENPEKLSAEDRARLESVPEKSKNKVLFPKRIEEAREMLRKARFVNGAEKIFGK